MRFFMIAAAMSVAALGFSGCASTGGCPTGGCSTGGCSTGGCGAGVIDGCGEAGCTDCQVPQASECSCGGGGCASCLSGIHGGAPGGYASGLQNTSMALSLFDRGSKCGGGAGCKLGGCKLGGCLLGLRPRRFAWPFGLRQVWLWKTGPLPSVSSSRCRCGRRLRQLWR